MSSPARAKKRLSRALSVAAVTAAVLWAAPQYVAQAPELFTTVDAGDVSPEAAARIAQRTGVLRSRYVKINLDALPSGPSKDAVDLNLFADVNLEAFIDQVDRRGWDSASWIGRLAGAGDSQVLFVNERGSVAATIQTADGRLFQVRDAGGGDHAILEIDQSLLIDDPPEADMEVRNLDLTQADAEEADQADRGTYIHVLVVYTAAMRATQASQAAMDALIKLGIDETNAGYAASGITTRVRLAGSAQIAYAESGNITTDRNRLQDPNDGFMDDAHTLRNRYRADLVSLWTANGGGYCGIAFIMSTPTVGFAPYGFNVVDGDDCATGYYSFGHEMGHIQSARHDRYVDNTANSPYAFNHGYYTNAPAYNGSATFRTVMAYANGNGSAPRINRWSNPNLTYTGLTTGALDADSGVWSTIAADNRRTLNSTDTYVANFMRAYLQPSVVADYFGNSATDVAVYTAAGRWWVRGNAGIQNIQYGGGNFLPVPGDYNHDGVFDIAVYEQVTGRWWVRGNPNIQNFLYGSSLYKAVPGDYDGDGGTDIAVYSTSGRWWVYGNSSIQNFGYGGATYSPVPGDYDGDDDTDIAVYSDSGRWWVYGNSSIQNLGYGGANFVPVPGDYDGDGTTDIAVYDTSNGRWWVRGNSSLQNIGYGGGDYVPVPGDYDGDGTTDIAVYHTVNGTWWVRGMAGPVTYGSTIYTPIPRYPWFYGTYTCPACDEKK